MAAGMALAKMTPLPVAAWVLGVGGRRGFVTVCASAAAVAALSLLGAGLTSYLDYLGVMRATNTTGLTDLSLGALGRDLGLPISVAGLLPSAWLFGGALLAGLLAVRRRRGLGFAVAVVAWTFGTPVVNINTPVLLLAALAPLAWPWPAETAGQARRDASQSRAADGVVTQAPEAVTASSNAT